MIRLGSILGTTITVDFTFLVVAGLFAANDYNNRHAIEHALLWFPVAFVSVLVHELAHAAAIGLFGYGPSEILLGGMGGSTMNRRVAKHWHNMIISLAGPFASFGLFFLVIFTYWRVPFFNTDPMMVQLLPLFALVNLSWGEFNLLPIPPLDGGHALRSLLRIFLREGTAFRIAVWVAIVVGAATVVWGIFQYELILAAIISWFVFMNYQQWQNFRERGTPGD